MRLRAASVVIAFLLVVSATPPASSTTVLRMTDEDLAARADVVLHAKCVAKESRWSDDGTYIYTEYTLEVCERVKGDGEGRTFTFRSLGGVVGDRGYAIAGSPTYREKEELVAFLDKAHPKTGCRHAIGLAQGKFSVVERLGEDQVREKFAERDLDGLKLVDPRSGSDVTTEGEPRAKSERRRFVPFMEQVRGFVKKHAR